MLDVVIIIAKLVRLPWWSRSIKEQTEPSFNYTADRFYMLWAKNELLLQIYQRAGNRFCNLLSVKCWLKHQDMQGPDLDYAKSWRISRSGCVYECESLKWGNQRNQVPFKSSCTEYNPGRLLKQEVMTLKSLEQNRRLPHQVTEEAVQLYCFRSPSQSFPGTFQTSLVYILSQVPAVHSLQVTYLFPVKSFLSHLASVMSSR